MKIINNNVHKIISLTNIVIYFRDTYATSNKNVYLVLGISKVSMSTTILQVVKGEDIVHRIEHVKTDAEDRPLMPVLIIKSGIVPTPKPFYVSDKINE